MIADADEGLVISKLLRVFLYVLTVGYAVTGAALFFAPTWASGHFAWRVSAFVAMTIGGWLLGLAWVALTAAQRASWPIIVCPVLFLALFGIFETAVVVSFRDRLTLSSPLAWLYLATILATLAFALVALVDAWRRWPAVSAAGPLFGAVTRFFIVAFIVLVGVIGLYGLLAVPGMPALNRGVFPELLTPFTLRAFGAFYLAIAIAVIPLLWARGSNTFLTHAYGSYGLLVFITAAAFFYIEQFDFAARPTQAIYIGVYLAVAVVVGAYLVRYGTGAAGKAPEVS
jgi:hypothetical protein